MKEIQLTRDKIAIVDNEDYEYLSKFKWCYNGRGYAVRNHRLVNGKRITVFMHRIILKTPHGLQTDHINGDTLNNMRSNLRIATSSQNQSNRGKQRNNKSLYKGVSIHGNRWQAVIYVNKKQIYLGYFNSPEKAAHAYNLRASLLFGEFAKLNRIEGSMEG